MKKRARQIMRCLMAADGYVTSRELADRLQLSRRALMYALDEVDAWLAGQGMTRTLRVPGKGVHLDEAAASFASARLDIDAAEGLLDPTVADDRRLFLLFSFMCVDTRLTVDSLAERLETSVRTVSSDVSTLRGALRRQNLVLTYSKRDGYRLDGNVFAARNLLLGWMRRSLPLDTASDAARTLSALLVLTGDEASHFDADALVSVAGLIEDVLPNQYERSVRQTILLQIAVMALERSNTRSYGLGEADREFLAKSAMFELARFLRLRSSELLGVALTDDEDFYLGTLLQSLPTCGAGDGTQNYPFELEVMAQRLILSVSEGYGFDFHYDPELFGIVFAHAVSLSHRLLFNAQITNPLLGNIVEKYERLHAAVVSASAELGSYLGSPVSEDECSFFTLYFASSIEKLANARRGRDRVIVVCNAGNAVSRLLQYRLINAFNVDIAAAVAGSELARALASAAPVDLVLTAVEVDPSVCAGVPCLRVSPLLSDGDYQRLSRYLGKRVFAGALGREEPGRGLLDLFPAACFEVYDSAQDMDELIRLGGDLLLREGLCDDEYPRQMVAAAHCFGPLTTILIAPGLIMPHAGISDHVLGTGFSFVRLRTPVTVNGKDVTCALSLCTRDKKINQNAIQQVGMLLSGTEFLKKVNTVDTYGEFAELVNGCLTQAKERK